MTLISFWGAILIVCSRSTFPTAVSGSSAVWACVIGFIGSKDSRQPWYPNEHPWVLEAGGLSFAFYMVHQIILINLIPHLAGVPAFFADALLL